MELPEAFSKSFPTPQNLAYKQWMLEYALVLFLAYEIVLFMGVDMSTLESSTLSQVSPSSSTLVILHPRALSAWFPQNPLTYLPCLPLRPQARMQSEPRPAM